jgi:hypothetical protein
MIILNVYPGFKSAFSDVVGYYIVSGSATNVLTKLLIDKDVKNSLDESNYTPEQKSALLNTADVILKICGNTSLLINQMVPSNFNEYWNILKPLMKPEYQVDGEETEKIKNDLLHILVTKDNIGEAMWFIYTGILLISIIQMKITTRGCVNNPQTMEQNYQTFLENEEKANEKAQKANEMVYTVS